MSTFTTKLIILAIALQSISAICGDGVTDKMCRGCANTTSCSLCTYGFVNSATGLCQKSTSISNCLTYSAVGVCSVCEYGYYINTSGSQCTTIPLSGCDRLNDNTLVSCQYCANRILVDANGTCNSVSCTDTNCKYCTRNFTTNVESCDRCNDDYVNQVNADATNTCVRENSNTDDCYYSSVNATNSNSDAAYCILCDVDHYISNGTCQQSGLSNSNNDNNTSAGSLSLFFVGLLMAFFA